jgi:glycosyltransferase involved in cell wall biosynthesis
VEAITTISDGLRDEVADLAGVPADSVAVWRSGCSWCEADSDGPVPPSRDRRAGDRVVVVYHGSVSAGRGLFEAVRAVGAIRADAPDLRLTVLGAGPALHALRRLVGELGLADRVTFLDPVPQDRVQDVLRRADLGLVPLPRRWEWEVSSPLKLVEYLCAGLPVVITDIRAHRVVPDDAAFAFRAPSAGPTDLAEAMLRAYRRRDELPALGRQAAAWARPRLGWSAQLSVLEGVMDGILALRAAARERAEARAGGRR